MKHFALSAALGVFLSLTVSPSLAADPAAGASCTGNPEGVRVCYGNGCFKCTSSIWVAEPLVMGTDVSTSCTTAGMIRWNGTVFQGCDGTAWTVLGGGGGASPAGTVLTFAGASVPSGWLLCDGAAVSRTTYASLFAAIGTAHGSGDGSTTFNLPDMRGRVPIGVGQGTLLTNRTLGQKLGEETHKLTISEMPKHSHNYNIPSPTYNQEYSGTAGVSQNAGSPSYATSDTGGDQAHNVMQPSYALNYIIKY